jgi:hypothetical protein
MVGESSIPYRFHFSAESSHLYYLFLQGEIQNKFACTSDHYYCDFVD